MGQFKYSKDELDMNKVLKMNQDISSDMMNDLEQKKKRELADSNIDSSIELLRSLGKNEDIIKLSDDVTNNNNRRLEHAPILESWEEIVAQANLIEPNIVQIEDFMTPDEIQKAFDELGEINAKFSKKTSIVNKTDLAFLVIATALQVTKSLVFPYVAEKFGYGESFDPKDRLDHNDKSIEKKHREANDKFRDKKLKKNPTGQWINMLYQTVPYDITKGSNELGINMGGRYHRFYTLGHDPILGWLFGNMALSSC